MSTVEEFEQILAQCRSVFELKMKDYGTAWRILRPSSLTDQIYIKANRIRSLQEKQCAQVDEGIQPEFVAIVNYAIMGLIQIAYGFADGSKHEELHDETMLAAYDEQAQAALALMQRKNHDYGEAWRLMRVSSLVDLILMKIFRTKQIEDNQGETIVSEGIDANYLDMLNYAVFALIKLTLESKES